MELKGIATRDATAEKVSEVGSKWLRSKYATWFLAFISFIESMFAPILIDPFLIALIMAKRELWKWYVSVSVVSSVLGGLAGYVLGALFFDVIGTTLLDTFGFQDEFASITSSVDANGFVFVLIGAVTPVPYKLVALASGLLQLDLVTFIVASLVGRLFRLGLVGYAAYAVGPKALPIMQRHMHLVAAGLAVLLVAYILYRFM